MELKEIKLSLGKSKPLFLLLLRHANEPYATCLKEHYFSIKMKV